MIAIGIILGVWVYTRGGWYAAVAFAALSIGLDITDAMVGSQLFELAGQWTAHLFGWQK